MTQPIVSRGASRGDPFGPRRGTGSSIVVAALALAAMAPQAHAGRDKLALLSLSAQNGLGEGLASVVEEMVLAQLSQHADVLSQREITAMLELEQQKQLLGCDENSTCMTELAGALGVSRLVAGSVARLGDQYLINLKLIDPVKGVVVRRVTETIPAVEGRLPGGVERAVRGLFSAEAPGRPAFDGKAFTARFTLASECEQEARKRVLDEPARGWEALQACVAKGRFPRGEYTDLRTLLADPWRQELLARADAPALVAKVVALRGGDVEGDLRRVRDAQIPLFGLIVALQQPQAYVGRSLLVRGRAKSVDTERGRTVLRIAETSQAAVQDFSPRTDNVSVPTKRELSATLARPDPFLELGREYVFLVKFSGTQREEYAGLVAVGSLEAYVPPSVTLTE